MHSFASGIGGRTPQHAQTPVDGDEQAGLPRPIGGRVLAARSERPGNARVLPTSVAVIDMEQEMLALRFQNAADAVLSSFARPEAIPTALVNATIRFDMYRVHCGNRDQPLGPAVRNKVVQLVAALERRLIPGEAPLNELDLEQLQTLQMAFSEPLFEDCELGDVVDAELMTFGDDGEREAVIHAPPAQADREPGFTEQLQSFEVRAIDAIDEVSECASNAPAFLKAVLGAAAVFRQCETLCAQEHVAIPAGMVRQRFQFESVLAYHLNAGAWLLSELDGPQLLELWATVDAFDCVGPSNAIHAEYVNVQRNFAAGMHSLQEGAVRSMADRELVQVAASARRAGVTRVAHLDVDREICRRGIEARRPRAAAERHQLEASFMRGLIAANDPSASAADFAAAVIGVAHLHEAYTAHCDHYDEPPEVKAALNGYLASFHDSVQIRLQPVLLRKLTDSELEALAQALPMRFAAALSFERDLLSAHYRAGLDEIHRQGMASLSTERLVNVLGLSMRQGRRDDPWPEAIREHLVARREAVEAAGQFEQAADEAMEHMSSATAAVRAIHIAASAAARYAALCQRHQLPSNPATDAKFQQLRSALVQTMVPGAAPLNQLDVRALADLARAVEGTPFSGLASRVAEEVRQARELATAGLLMIRDVGLARLSLSRLHEIRRHLARVDRFSPDLTAIKARIEALEAALESA